MKHLLIALLLTLLMNLGLVASSPTRATENTGQGYGYGYSYPESDLGITPAAAISIEPRVYLKDFLDQHELAVWMSTAPWVFPQPTPDFDCDDFARAFQKIAEEDGYRLNITLIETDDPKKPHMLNSAVVDDNELWYIEPQNHTYWFKVYLDPPARD